VAAPKVALIDIETFPNVGYTWGKYDQTVLKFKQRWELASFAWKPLGHDRVRAIARPDFKDATDESLVRAVRAVVDEQDVLIGHNVDRFDSPKLKAKFAQYGMTPTSYRTVDTLRIARSQFAFESNKLEEVAEVLGVGRKLRTGGFDLWARCMANDPAAWRRMVAYNKRDVTLLERVYVKLRAWYPQHVAFNLFRDGEETRPTCPVCGSTKSQRRGYLVYIKRRAARHQCLRCHHWFSRPLGKGAT
jgi:hypothetical protein